MTGCTCYLTEAIRHENRKYANTSGVSVHRAGAGFLPAIAEAKTVLIT